MHARHNQRHLTYWVGPDSDAQAVEPEPSIQPHMFAQFRSYRFECTAVAFVDPHTKSEKVMKGSFGEIARQCASNSVITQAFVRETGAAPRVLRKPQSVSFNDTANEDPGDRSYRPSLGAPRHRAPVKASSKPGRKKRAQQPQQGWFCTACGVTATVQQRRSSLGPATLCNRCGLLWTKGRLPGIDRLAKMQGRSVGEPMHPHSAQPSAASDKDIEWIEYVWNINDPPESQPRADERMGISFLTS